MIATVLDRLPIIRNGKLVQYQFEHYLKVIDIYSGKVNLDETVKDSFLDSIKDDPDRWVEFDHQPEKTYYPLFEIELRKVGHYFYPKISPRLYLSTDESDNLVFNETTKR